MYAPLTSEQHARLTDLLGHRRLTYALKRQAEFYSSACYYGSSPAAIDHRCRIDDITRSAIDARRQVQRHGYPPSQTGPRPWPAAHHRWPGPIIPPDAGEVAQEALLVILSGYNWPVTFGYSEFPGRYWGNVLVKLPIILLQWVQFYVRDLSPVRYRWLARGNGRQVRACLVKGWRVGDRRAPRRCQRRQFTFTLAYKLAIAAGDYGLTVD